MLFVWGDGVVGKMRRGGGGEQKTKGGGGGGELPCEKDRD